jgi:hypothetical protein
VSAVEAGARAVSVARAQAIQKTLLAGAEIDPIRVFLSGNLPATGENGRVRLELGLD